jgi:hypothetical protein
MEHPSTDLEIALTFVIKQIDEEAARSGAPLDDDERYFLRHLPAHPTNSTFNSVSYSESPLPILRDYSYETLCTLAKNARLYDIGARPEASRDWDFSAAVFQLEHHPMSWLLHWAGMKKKRPRWDRWFLLGTAILAVFMFLFGAITLSVLTEGLRAIWKWIFFIAGGCISLIVLVFAYVATQRLEKRELRKLVDRHRSSRTINRGGAT